MSESRVARWRERLQQAGKKAVTLWLPSETERRLKEIATTWHCSPSEVVQHALDQFHPGLPSRLSNDTKTSQIRHDYDTETEQIRTVLRQELPGMVQALFEECRHR